MEKLPYKIDETGNKYGRLTVLGYSHTIKGRGTFWNCHCDCGKQAIVNSNKLRNNHTQSCGCLGKEKLELRNSHGLSRSKEYRIWASMLQRCNNPKDKKYNDYGGRGIKVLDRWELFENFHKDMGECPDGFSLERVDVNGNYCKDNCKWETTSNQNFNQRIRKNNSTGRTGVDYIEKHGCWRARITFQLKEILLGRYVSFEEACKAREEAELKYFGKIKE